MEAFIGLSWVFPSLIALPILFSPVIYLVGRLQARRAGGPNAHNPARWIALAGLVLDLGPLYLTWRQLQTGEMPFLQEGMVRLQMDGIGLLLAAVVLGLGIMAVLFSTRYMQNELGEEKFYALLSAMIGTIIGLGMASDLFNLWVWFEAMSISSYTLVAFYRDQKASLEAGFKYLVQSAAGSILVLLAIALVFAGRGTLDLTAAHAATLSPLLAAAGAMFVIGFGVKVALVPMHTWLPDAHSQAPSGISAMLSGVVIEAGLVALLRVLSNLIPIRAAVPQWEVILLGFAVLNMLLGNLMALRQVQVKRMLAFSSISHVGYMMVGISAALIFGSVDGAAGSFFHIITHAAMKGLAFLSAGALLYGLYLAKGEHGALMLDDLNGSARRYPLAAFAFSVAVLGLGGLPPLAGFMSKWQIFAAGFETGSPWMIAVVIFAAVNSVISLGYYAPLVNRMYRNEMSDAVKNGRPLSKWMMVPLIGLVLVIIILGIWPVAANGLTLPAARSLIAALGS